MERSGPSHVRHFLDCSRIAGEKMRDQRDLLVPLVGMLLYVAMAMAMIAAVMARF